MTMYNLLALGQRALGLSAMIACLTTYTACTPEVVAPKGEVLPCNINSNKTLTDINPDGVDYIVECDAEVTNGTLTIEPGVIIEFKTSARLIIKDMGIIKANGTDTKHIIMRGTSSATGAWDGVSIESNNSGNQMSYVEVLNAGETENFNTSVGGFSYDKKTAVAVYGKLSIKNCIVKGSGGDGISFSTEATVLGFENNTLTQNARYPIVTYCGHINAMNFATCTLTGNTQSYIAVFSTSSNNEVEETTTFKATSIPFLAINDLYFQSDLTFDAGAVLVFQNDLGLGIQGNGRILTNGTAAKPVIWRGESEVAGYWRGCLVNTVNPLNVLNHTIIADAGSSENAYSTGKTSLAVGSVVEAKLTINNISAPRFVNCAVSVGSSSWGATMTNNSPEITSICTY